MLIAGLLLSAVNLILCLSIIFFLIKIIFYFRNKNYKKIILILIGYLVCFILMVSFVVIDVSQIKETKNPIFSVPTLYPKDGGSKKYVGFGYSIWSFNILSEETVNNKEVFGIIKGYQIEFLFIPLKDHSYFVSDK